MPRGDQLSIVTAILCCWVLLEGAVSATQLSVAATHEALRQRSTNEFLRAVFYKPSGTNDSDLEFKEAPLILQELADTSPATGDGFGALALTNSDVTLAPDQPQVYFFADSVNFGGKPHARLAYLWFYVARARSSAGDAALPAQGVRITLGSAGEPVIWEVLADSSGLKLVYVSEKLEAAAKAEVGPPLPGRKYAVDRSLADAPNSVVVRVIDDGPAPMGPIVYLSAGNRDVSTVTCRCMAAQAKVLVTTRTYELVNAERQPSQTSVALMGIQVRGRASFWPGEREAELDSCLRLPRSF